MLKLLEGDAKALVVVEGNIFGLSRLLFQKKCHVMCKNFEKNP